MITAGMDISELKPLFYFTYIALLHFLVPQPFTFTLRLIHIRSRISTHPMPLSFSVSTNIDADCHPRLHPLLQPNFTAALNMTESKFVDFGVVEKVTSTHSPYLQSLCLLNSSVHLCHALGTSKAEVQGDFYPDHTCSRVFDGSLNDAPHVF